MVCWKDEEGDEPCALPPGEPVFLPGEPVNLPFTPLHKNMHTPAHNYAIWTKGMQNGINPTAQS